MESDWNWLKLEKNNLKKEGINYEDGNNIRTNLLKGSPYILLLFLFAQNFDT